MKKLSFKTNNSAAETLPLKEEEEYEAKKLNYVRLMCIFETLMWFILQIKNLLNIDGLAPPCWVQILHWVILMISLIMLIYSHLVQIKIIYLVIMLQ